MCSAPPSQVSRAMIATGVQPSSGWGPEVPRTELTSPTCFRYMDLPSEVPSSVVVFLSNPHLSTCPMGQSNDIFLDYQLNHSPSAPALLSVSGKDNVAGHILGSRCHFGGGGQGNRLRQTWKCSWLRPGSALRITSGGTQWTKCVASNRTQAGCMWDKYLFLLYSLSSPRYLLRWGTPPPFFQPC